MARHKSRVRAGAYRQRLQLGVRSTTNSHHVGLDLGCLPLPSPSPLPPTLLRLCVSLELLPQLVHLVL